MKATYLDNAASTQPAIEVLTAMTDVARDVYANPSSAHGGGAEATRVLDAARADVAAAWGAQPGEVVFTSGGTEANALGILGATTNQKRRHLVVGALEHPSVLRNLERLALQSGFELSVAVANAAGVIIPEAVVTALRPDTALVCVMYVNNELGTIQPIADIARALQSKATQEGTRRPHFHVDAVQAFGHLRFRAPALGADTVSLSGHKIHGPKGVGALWIRGGARVEAVWDGGRQERGLRSGTENVAGAVGLARAAQLAAQGLAAGIPLAIEARRDQFERQALAKIPGLRTTVTDAARAPQISSLAIPGLPAEPLLHALEARGVFVSAGAACASKHRAPSHVLKAIGIDDHTAVLRFSFSRNTTDSDVERAVDALVAAVEEIGNTPGQRKRRTARP